MVSFAQLSEFVLDDVVAVAFREAARAGLPMCEGCLSRWLARQMVLEVLPALRADYDRQRPLTVEQVRALIQDVGRNAPHLSLCCVNS